MWSFYKTHASLPFQIFSPVLLKGSLVLMICQKMTKMPIICNIPDRVVAVRVGPIFTKEDGEPNALAQGEEPWGVPRM